MPRIHSPADDLDFVEALDLAQLVPQQYARYRPLVKEGLRFFLERLPSARLAAILAEQLQLPPNASSVTRIVVALRHCPTLHKLGQVVARDQRLAPELREQLQGLESLTPTTPMPAIRQAIQEELGERKDIDIAAQALAEASVAVVVPFYWHVAGTARPREGVFKVLKPGVETALREDLEVWPALGAFIEERCEDYGLPAASYRETLESVRTLLLNEIRLDGEQAHLAAAAELYAHTPEVLIPRLLPFCTPRLTAMERIHGRKVTDIGELPPAQRRRLAATLVDALIGKPFWSEAASATFHADPHAGNLFLSRDGRLAILDWSLVSRLDKTQRQAIVEITLGALTLDAARIYQALATLQRTPPEPAALRSIVADALRQVRLGAFPGFDWLLALLDRLAVSAGMSFPEDLTLFRKTLFTLSAVVKDVSAESSLGRALVFAGLRQFLRELPGRAADVGGSHTFGTHVSNRELAALWASLPFSAARFWIDNYQDILSAGLNQISPSSASDNPAHEPV